MAIITIDDEDLVQRLHELARREGKSIDEVIIDLATDRLDRMSTKRFSDETRDYWTKFGDEVRSRMSPEMLALNVDDEMYDEYGLPK